ncbi:MAG: RecX family transcriptional regulator [Clostridia bacterium]|nr:RecX family transcriptional regulator [Clostridia bacterium]
MSEITGINKCGKDKYNIFLDGIFYCTLKAETILKAGLKSGINISKEEIEELQMQNEKLIAFDRCLRYLENLKTEKQVRDYLYSKGYTTKTVNYCIEKLHNYKYLNDEEFAKLYVNSYATKKGKRLLEFELKTRGIKEEIIKNVLENNENNEEILVNLAQKFIKNKPRDKKTAQKLFAHLSSKGFNFDEINKVIKKLIYDFEENEDEIY